MSETICCHGNAALALLFSLLSHCSYSLFATCCQGNMIILWGEEGSKRVTTPDMHMRMHFVFLPQSSICHCWCGISLYIASDTSNPLPSLSFFPSCPPSPLLSLTVRSPPPPPPVALVAVERLTLPTNWCLK